MNSVLYGLFRPMLFIHDEILGELPDGDPQLIASCVLEIESIMIAAMRTITPDVEPRCEAVLMYRWNKFADPTFDEKGNLIATIEKGDERATQTGRETEAEAETQAEAQTEVATAEVAL